MPDIDPVITKPRVVIVMASTILGGPGKGLLQFLLCGGLLQSVPLVCNFLVKAGEPWQFRDEFVKAGVPFTPLRQRFTYDPFLIPQAYRLVNSNRIQILQSHGYKSHALCLILKLLTGVPWVGFVHGWTNENWKIRLYHKLDLTLLRFADKCVVVAEKLRSQLVASGISDHKIVTIRNAINTGELPPDSGHLVRTRYALADTDFLVGVIGRFSPEKGHSYFIEALRQLVANHRQIKALLVGDGQEEQALRDQVTRLGLDDHVIFTGYQEDVIPFIRAIDILVLPSLSEGMPNAALEAMACAKPVVATRVGGIPEVVVDGVTGLLVEAAQPGELAGAMIALMDDRGRAEAYGAAGMARVRNEFDPYVRAKKIMAVYHDLLGSNYADR